MNEWGQAILLACVQGLTEFLPVSSSAHLILVPLLLGWPDQGFTFDVAVHLGTLLAVCIYFRTELKQLVQGLTASLRGQPSSFYSRFAWQLGLATFPIALCGWLAHDTIAKLRETPILIAFTTIGFGILLGLTDKYTAQNRPLTTVRWKDALLIGLVQILALLPGASRSGLTLTAGRSLQFDRAASAKFSFLLSIPVILLASSYESYRLFSSAVPLKVLPLLVGMGVAAINAYLCIHFFLTFIRKIGVFPFVIYRLILGMGLLWLFW